MLIAEVELSYQLTSSVWHKKLIPEKNTTGLLCMHTCIILQIFLSCLTSDLLRWYIHVDVSCINLNVQTPAYLHLNAKKKLQSRFAYMLFRVFKSCSPKKFSLLCTSSDISLYIIVAACDVNQSLSAFSVHCEGENSVRIEQSCVW